MPYSEDKLLSPELEPAHEELPAVASGASFKTLDREVRRLRIQAERHEQQVERLLTEIEQLQIRADAGRDLYGKVLTLVEREAPRVDYLAVAKGYELRCRNQPRKN